MAQRINDSTDTSLLTADLVADLAELFARKDPLQGSWTPTLTNTTNVAASTTYATCYYANIGSWVACAGSVDIDPSAASTLTQIEISVPVASNFGSTRQLVGGAARVAGAGLNVISGSVLANTTNDTAVLSFLNDTDVANRAWTFWFVYQVFV